MTLPRIVITSGEPAGIGPDLCVAMAGADWNCSLIVAGDAALLADTADVLGVPLRIETYDPAAPVSAHRPGVLPVLDIRCNASVTPGRTDVRNARYVLSLLDRACDGCASGEFAAMVTAPVQKSVIMEAGFAFVGHTEYLAYRVQAPLPVMLLTGANLRVALVTTHLPLSQVSAHITPSRLMQTLRIVAADLSSVFGIARPRLRVLGLNPHAGESGHLGREEIEIIAPVLDALRAEGLVIEGPMPADTAFGADAPLMSDVIVAMYHDQGLPVLKHASFGEAVNVTLGLPFLRTSVDHGTALSLARSGRAGDGSLRAALRLAIELSSARR